MHNLRPSSTISSRTNASSVLSQNGFLNPGRLIASLGILRPGMHVADFGCGSGYFTLPIAKIVGSGGQVNAVDVLPKALEAVSSLAKMEGLFNIRTIRGNLETKAGSRLAPRSQDAVFIVNMLHQSKHKKTVLTEAERVLKTQGMVVIIDWETHVVVRPSQGWFLTQEEAAKLAHQLHFRVLRRFTAGLYHWGLVLIKNKTER